MYYLVFVYVVFFLNHTIYKGILHKQKYTLFDILSDKHFCKIYCSSIKL